MNKFVMIVGAQKCGTTSMHNWLGQHPYICMSDPKEPQYFEREYWKGIEFYKEKYFSHYNGETHCGEARVHNLIIKYVPERVKETFPDAKIIIMVRNPIHRYISAWNHFRVMRPGREIKTLNEAISEDEFTQQFNPNPAFQSEEEFCTKLDPAGGPYDCAYLETGVYIDHIRRWSEWFGGVKVVVMEDLFRPHKVYNEVLDFIGAGSFTPEFVKMNVKPKDTSHNDSSYLRGYYRRSVDELSEYMQRDLTNEWGFDTDD